MLLCENIVLLCSDSRSGLAHPPDFSREGPPWGTFQNLVQIIAVGGAILSIVERSGAVKGG